MIEPQQGTVIPYVATMSLTRVRISGGVITSPNARDGARRDGLLDAHGPSSHRSSRSLDIRNVDTHSRIRIVDMRSRIRNVDMRNCIRSVDMRTRSGRNPLG
jgi:hypothetical protein